MRELLKSSLYDRAASFIGTEEISGKQHNPQIVEWLNGVLSWVTDDETPWCAAFVNAMLNDVGISGTSKLNARSFLNWGQETYYPDRGDIVVLWRSSIDSWKGHVGFFDSYETRDGVQGVNLLGGNQRNKVGIDWYPLSRVLAYRTILGQSRNLIS